MRSLEEPDRDRRLGEGRELVLDGDRVSVWAGVQARILEWGTMPCFRGSS